MVLVVNKTLNIILMVLMAILALLELKTLVTRGFDLRTGVFFLIFAGFAVRRFLLMSKYS